MSKKLDAFEVVTEPYKTVDGHDVLADVLIPKEEASADQTQHPVIVRFHGGALVLGSRAHEPWYPKWLLEYAASVKAIIVSADYRLMPESTGLDILKDLDDLWAWLQSDLQSVVSKSTNGKSSVDLKHILSTGESAGGYLSVLFGLAHHNDIQAVIAEYATLDLKEMLDSWYQKPNPMPFLPSPIVSNEFIDKYIAAIDPKKGPVSSIMAPDRTALSFGIMQQGRYLDFLGSDPKLYPLQRIEDGETLPPTLLVHGTADSAVPIEGSHKFLAAIKKKAPNAEVMLVEYPGGQHFFDSEVATGDWIAPALEFVSKAWLGQ